MTINQFLEEFRAVAKKYRFFRGTYGLHCPVHRDLVVRGGEWEVKEVDGLKYLDSSAVNSHCPITAVWHHKSGLKQPFRQAAEYLCLSSKDTELIVDAADNNKGNRFLFELWNWYKFRRQLLKIVKDNQ